MQRKSFKSFILGSKIVANWGAGYLGYTSALQLQQQGFRVHLYDFNKPDLAEHVRTGRYPLIDQSRVWTKDVQTPALNPDLVTVCTDPMDMFDCPVHIITYPMHLADGTKLYEHILGYFLSNVARLEDCLILFTATQTPGSTERYFIRPLLDAGAQCSFACALRSDWRLEEFLSRKDVRPIAGWDTMAYAKAEIFMSLLGVPTTRIMSIKAAEVYECAKNALNYTVAAFVNQLALAYPDVDVRNISRLLASNIIMGEVEPSVGNVGHKIANSIDHLLAGISGTNALSTLHEAQSTNIASILFYADIAKREGTRSVAILGLAAPDSLRDVALSPSIILAEYLHRRGVEVVINDPNFSSDEIKTILPFAKVLDIGRQKVASDAVFLMKSLEEYRAFTLHDLLAKGIGTARLIIDNTGLFRDYEFAPGTRYHVPGDGSIG